jgi:multicomponent K+:H+ antiporter subunit E
MSRLFPAPLLSALLFVAWLMLNGSLSTGHLLLAALLAWAIPGLTTGARPDRPRVRAFGTLLRLSGVVLYDIAKSNVDVARRVLGPESALEPRFVWVPLDIRCSHGIVVLASIITLTPGTVSSALSEDRRHLLVHALHCPGAEAEAALIADIKLRYETPLREIFE